MSEDDLISAILTCYTRNVPEMSPFMKDNNYKKYVTPDILTMRLLLVTQSISHSYDKSLIISKAESSEKCLKSTENV